MGMAVGLAAMQTAQSFCQHHFFYRSMTTGALVRGTLISAIFRKSLVLSNKSRLEYTNGKITNLMSTDASRIDFCAGYFHISMGGASPDYHMSCDFASEYRAVDTSWVWAADCVDAGDGQDYKDSDDQALSKH